MDAFTWPQAIGADQAWVGGQHQRSVGKAGVSADLLVAKAFALQQPGEFGLAGPVILFDGVRANTRRRPLAIEPIGDRPFASLIAAVIAEKNDVAEAGELEAARGVFEGSLERLFRNGDRAGKPHVLGRR